MYSRRALTAILMASVLCIGGVTRVQADSVRQVIKGRTTIAIHSALLEQFGIRVETNAAMANGSLIELDILPDSDLQIVESGGVLTGVQGDRIVHDAVVVFHGPAGSVALDGFNLALDTQAQYATLIAIRDAGDRTPMISVSTEKMGFDRIFDSLQIEGSELVMLPSLAQELGMPKTAGLVIGEYRIESGLEFVAGDDGSPAPDPEGDPRGGNNGTVCGVNAGPDVIVGTLVGTANYDSQEIPAGSGNWIDAFSVGTTSCNIGTQGLKWISSTNEHPVIGQNFFRYYVDAGGVSHFEQLGQSWLKHGFTALQGNECGCGCISGNGSLLGVGCSDPYGASLNGGQGSAGPKWQVNAHTGIFTYPPANPSFSGSVARRMQIRVADLNQPGARYFMEGQYIQPEDAQFNNDNNNASYIEVTVSGSGNNRSYTLQGTTQRERPGIRAWKSVDPAVQEVDVQVPNEGLFIISGKATALAGGFYHYEYAVQNLNSDRSARSFSVPLPSGVTVQNIGFRDVDYHSGDGEGNVNRSGTDWPATWTPGGSITWSTPDFTTEPNGNAIRWGTMYNFRFDADAPPGSLNVSLGMFKPGTPASVSASIVGPAGPPPVCGDSVVEGGEECDPPGNGCDAECQWICGDGIAHPPAEPCDSGGVNTAGCDSDCTPVECGDGHTNTAAGEACDDAGDSANCDGDCSAVSCGDGYINEAAGEECDPPGPNCDASCQRIPMCGDGVIDPGEQCDDGNNVSGDGCSATCVSEYNDDCIAAISISEGVTAFSTVAATTDGVSNGSSCQFGGQTYADIWYTYTPTCSGNLTVSTCGTADYDSDLVVYNTCTCTPTVANLLGCNDDGSGCSGYTSRLTVPVVVGNCYLIRVGGWNSESDRGSGTISLTNSGSPCGTVCGNGVLEAGEQCDDGNTVSGDGCSSTCQIEQPAVCGNGVLEAGEQCDDGNNVSGDGCSATCQVETIAPPNDACANAIVICPSTEAGSTLNGTTDGSAGCGSSNSTADVWYSYTPGSSGTLTLDTCSSANYDTVLSVHTACPGTSLNQVACNDDDPGCSGNRSRLSTPVTGGATYYLRVSGWNGASGNFVLVVDGPACGTIVDCNSNGRDDAEDIACGLDNYCNDIAGSGDCNNNGTPDDCEIALGAESDCDGGPIGSLAAGAARFQSICQACHGPSGTSVGCAGACPGPNIRNKTREQIRLHLDPPIGTHGGGQHPDYTRQDYADLEAFLSDTGSHGRPDGVPDACQTLADCDNDLVGDGCELEAGTQVDPDGDGVPSDCEECPNDPNKTLAGNCGCGNPETAATGDMDGSGTVNGADIQWFVDSVMVPSTDPVDLCPGDFDNSHVMDANDVAGFVAALMAP